MEHIIQRQTFEITAPTVKLMQDWERRAQGILNDVINPVVDRCFTDASMVDEITMIDTLEIDLGIVNKMTHRQIIDKVTSALLQQLKDKKQAVASSLAVDDVTKGLSNEVMLKTLGKQGSIVSSFVYFLIHGRLPWWVLSDQINFSGEWIEHLSAHQVNTIAQTVSTHSYAIDRVVYQFGDTFISTLLQYYHRPLANSVLLNWKSLEEIFLLTDSKSATLRYTYWSYWMRKCMDLSVDENKLINSFRQWILNSPKVANTLGLWIGLTKSNNTAQVSSDKNKHGDFDKENDVVFKLLKNSIRIALGNEERLIESAKITERENTVREYERTVSEHEATKQNIADHTTEIKEAHHAKSSKQPGKVAREQNIISQQGMNNKGKAGGSAADKLHKINEQNFPEDDLKLLYTEASGLVLVHPFLAELFRSTALWGNNQWTSPEAQHIAVRLVTWLAFGNNAIPEYQLTIPKLLCGMPWEEPLDTTAGLTEDRLNSGAELLEAIIKHWKALGKSSIDGLREGFIQREGKLTKRDDGWQLIIEKKAQDILVSKLPWGVTIIHLPWLGKNTIHVDWT